METRIGKWRLFASASTWCRSTLCLFLKLCIWFSCAVSLLGVYWMVAENIATGAFLFMGATVAILVFDIAFSLAHFGFERCQEHAVGDIVWYIVEYTRDVSLAVRCRVIWVDYRSRKEN